MLSIVKRSLSGRIALYASLCASLSIATVCSAIAWRAGQNAEADALTLARATARQAAGTVEGDLHATFAVVQALSRSLAEQKKTGLPIGRAQLDATLKATVEQWPNWLGFYSVWAPNALDGRDAEFAGANPGTDQTGRFLSWWNRLEGKVSVSAVGFVDQAGANDWYDIPCASKRDTWLDVAPFETGGQQILASTLSLPIVVDDECVGIVAVDLALSTLQKRLQAIPVPIPGAEMALISQRGIYVSDPRADRLGQPAADQPKTALAQIAAGQSHQWNDDRGWIHLYTPVTMAPDLPAWAIEMRVPLAETHRASQALIRWATMVGILCVLLSSALMLLLVSRTTEPLRRLTQTLESLVVGASRLDVRLDSRGQDELARIASAFNAFVDKLRGAFGNVSEASSQVDVAASEIASGNQDLSQRTESQSAQLHSVSSAVHSLEDSIRNSAREARSVAAVAVSVQARATQSAQAMAEARKAMDALFDTSRRIEAIIGVIDELAAQTNILALNAGVESARAGDAGRGFAVVATEVRRLAQASTSSAQDIRNLITQAAANIDSGHRRIQGVDAAVRDLAASFSQVLDAVVQIEQRCSAQTVEVERVGSAVGALDGMTQQNAALVEQAAAASAALRQQTERLSDTVSEYLSPSGPSSSRA